MIKEYRNIVDQGKNSLGHARPPYSWQRKTLVAVLVSATVLVSPALIAAEEVVSDLDCIVEPSAIVDLGATTPGLLAQTYFDRSDYVSVGTVMARLESGLEEATLAIAEELAAQTTKIDLRKASAEFGERTRVRNVKLLKTSTISEQNMDQVDTETRVAKLQVRQEVESQRLARLEVERAAVSLSRRSIVSPIEGTVLQRFKEPGEYVDREAVYKIAQLNPLNVEVIVPLDYLGQIESGMRADVTLFAPGFEDDTLEATVRRIDAVADAASATFGVRLQLENPELSIPSGVRCRVDFYGQ
ncbi:MAG: efflux RND transporter periplasmic adaptor subunit [Granulosicoccaceae bacterium]